MRKQLLLILFTILSDIVFSQITITSADMPSVNGVFVVNTATPSPNIDPVPTGTNYTWDFSMLTNVTQHNDTFNSISSMPLVYWLAFPGSSFTVRGFQNINIGTFLTLSDIYNVYKKDTARYQYSGQGAEINSIPTPMVYSPRDVIYNFPLSYGDADSSQSGFSLTIPTLADYSKARKRVNVVDGWGTLMLPSGNFDVLRVKSTIHDMDTIVIQSFSIPFPSTTIEYKWLGLQQGEPLLQINASEIIPNQFAVTQVLYLENPVIGINDVSGSDFNFGLMPNPASTHISVFYNKDKTCETKIDIISIGGKQVKNIFSGKESAGATYHAFSVRDLAEGIYVMRISSAGNTSYRKFSVMK